MRVVVSKCAGVVLVFRRASVVYLCLVCNLLQCVVEACSSKYEQVLMASLVAHDLKRNVLYEAKFSI